METLLALIITVIIGGLIVGFTWYGLSRPGNPLPPVANWGIIMLEIIIIVFVLFSFMPGINFTWPR